MPKDSKGFKILAGGKLSCHAPDFKKYVDMIEVGIKRPKEDSTFRTSEVNKFINALTDTMERRSIIQTFACYGGFPFHTQKKNLFFMLTSQTMVAGRMY